ncbi:uncharacterized protein [Ptychodera flava]|uniref:uncharacterized protein n=1 Tax=Ptychodera flava TaxID=63121 RepID=UPI00396A1703
MCMGGDITFEEFLSKLKLDEQTYIDAIRSSLATDKVFLKRTPNDIRINSYNLTLLQAWRANMDIQFILDPYACAMYIVSYISKAQRGMSNLLERATKEAREGNKDIKDRVRHIGNKFLNHVEVSAQEAVYLVLQMSLRRATRDFVFINTSPPDSRTILLKPLCEIQGMPPESTDIETDSLIKKYQRRPKPLLAWCLADFAAWFDFHKDDTKHNQTNHYDDNVDDELVQPSSESHVSYKVGGLIYKKRQKCKVIRYVNFHKAKEPENHYRELLMLFHPWKSESELIENCDSYQEKYMQLKADIDAKRCQYQHNAEVLQQAIENLQNENAEQNNAVSTVAPNAIHNDEQDANQGSIENNDYASFNPDKPEHSNYDIGQDLGIAVNNPCIEDLQQPRMNKQDFHNLVRKLNEKQKEIFYHILNWVKTKDAQLCLFLTGGAGVGKSMVVKAIYQALLRYLGSLPGENPDLITMILMAPTGKAAYNLGGTTIHSALQIPASQGFHYRALSTDKLNTLQAKYRNLKVIFIDEISMVGNGMFHYVNLRLQQIMGNKKLFGGVSIISSGDLFNSNLCLMVGFFKI